MFRTFCILPFIAVPVLIILHAVVLGVRQRKGTPFLPLRWWEKLTYAVALLGLAAMGGTAFYSVLRHGTGNISGWTLWFHLAAAPVFIIGIVAVAYMWAELSRFGNRPGEVRPRCFDPLTSVVFWIMVTSAFVTISVMLLCMTPLLASETLTTMASIHRWSALVLTTSMIGHVYLVLVSPRKAVKTGPVPPASGAADTGVDTGVKTGAASA